MKLKISNGTIRYLYTLVFLAFIVAGGALLEASDSLTVNYGANQQITAFATCKKVTNNNSAGASVYVPTATSSEWTSFYTNPPSGVTVAACTCSGLSSGGYCYYISPQSASCVTTCAAHGGFNTNGCLYAASDVPTCYNILNTLTNDPALNYDPNFDPTPNGMGCHYVHNRNGFDYYYPKTTCTESAANYAGSIGKRVCACNN